MKRRHYILLPALTLILLTVQGINCQVDRYDPDEQAAWEIEFHRELKAIRDRLVDEGKVPPEEVKRLQTRQRELYREFFQRLAKQRQSNPLFKSLKQRPSSP